MRTPYISLLALLLCGAFPGFGAHCFCRVSVDGTEHNTSSYDGYVQSFPGAKEKCQDRCSQWYRDGIPQSQVLMWAQQSGTSTPYRCAQISVESHVGTQQWTTAVNPSLRLGNPCPYGGNFDGANCLVATPPPNLSPFMLEGNFYYSFASSNLATQCPVGSSDSAHCFLGKTPDDAVPFIYQQRFYYSATCNARAEWVGDSGALQDGKIFISAQYKETKIKVKISGQGDGVLLKNKKGDTIRQFFVHAGGSHVFAGLTRGDTYRVTTSSGAASFTYKIP